MEIHRVPVYRVAPLAKRHESDRFHYTTPLDTTKAAGWRLLGHRLASDGIGFTREVDGMLPSWIYSLFSWAARLLLWR